MADPQRKPVEDDDWIQVPAQAGASPAPAPGDDWTAAPTPQTPLNPDAPPAFQQPAGSALGRFGSGLWSNTGAAVQDAGKALWDLKQVAAGEKPELDSATKNIWHNILQSHADQAQKAKEHWEKGNYAEAAGHALATILPLIGPAAAHAGEQFGGEAPEFDKYGNVVKSGQAPDVARGLGESAGLLAPSATKAAVKGTTAAVKSIPRLARASAGLEDVTRAAGHLPIDITVPGQTALDIQQLAQRGGAMPKVVRDFLNRTTKPNSPPITFTEARDFYSNATRLSADEFNRLTPVMKRQVSQFVKDLDGSLEKTAGQAGKADAYNAAMKEYRNAMRVRRIGKEVKDVAKSNIGKGVGIGAGATATGYLYNKVWGKAKGGAILDRQPSRETVLASLKR